MDGRLSQLVAGIASGVCLGLFWSACATVGYGQDDATYTLRAYTNLIQIPVLVLNTSRERMVLWILSRSLSA